MNTAQFAHISYCSSGDMLPKLHTFKGSFPSVAQGGVPVRACFATAHSLRLCDHGEIRLRFGFADKLGNEGGIVHT